MYRNIIVIRAILLAAAIGKALSLVAKEMPSESIGCQGSALVSTGYRHRATRALVGCEANDDNGRLAQSKRCVRVYCAAAL